MTAMCDSCIRMKGIRTSLDGFGIVCEITDGRIWTLDAALKAIRGECPHYTPKEAVQ